MAGVPAWACHVAQVCRRSCQRSAGSRARFRAFRYAVLFDPLAIGRRHLTALSLPIVA
jgi:hypothetical protein